MFAGGVQPVFIDFLKNGQTIRTDTITPAPGGAALAFDLPAELSGPLQVSAYRFSPAGAPVRRSRVVFVRPASQVKLHARAGPGDVSPRAAGEGEFHPDRRQGATDSSAVSLSVVDKAVSAVLDQSSGLRGPSTSWTSSSCSRSTPSTRGPLSSQPGGREQQIQFEQALFARTAEDGSSRTPDSADSARRAGNGPWTGAAGATWRFSSPHLFAAAESFSREGPAG